MRGYGASGGSGLVGNYGNDRGDKACLEIYSDRCRWLGDGALPLLFCLLGDHFDAGPHLLPDAGMTQQTVEESARKVAITRRRLCPTPVASSKADGKRSRDCRQRNVEHVVAHVGEGPNQVPQQR